MFDMFYQRFHLLFKGLSFSIIRPKNWLSCKIEIFKKLSSRLQILVYFTEKRVKQFLASGICIHLTYQITQWSHAIVHRSRTNAMVIHVHVDTMLLRIMLYICLLHAFLLLCKLEKNRTNAQSLIAELTIAIETDDRRPWWWLLTFVLLGCDI